MLLSWWIRWWNVCVWLLFMCLPYFTISLMSSNQSISSELIPTDRTGLLCCSDTVLPSHQTAGLHLHDSHLEIIHVCVCVCACVFIVWGSVVYIICMMHSFSIFVRERVSRGESVSRRAPPSHTFRHVQSLCGGLGRREPDRSPLRLPEWPFSSLGDERTRPAWQLLYVSCLCPPISTHMLLHEGQDLSTGHAGKGW